MKSHTFADGKQVGYGKKKSAFCRFNFCAHEKTRTSKSVRSLHPECSVFTNFTTWASGGISWIPLVPRTRVELA